MSDANSRTAPQVGSVADAPQRVALITGASRGIGAETARMLAEQGYALVLAARSADALEVLAAELRAAGATCHVVPTNVRSPAALQALAAEALGRFGQIDVLLHNAGVVHPGVVVSQLSDAQVAEMVETNLMAPITLTRLILPHMLARGSGFIGFVASVGGHVAIPSAALYSTTKFGLRGFAGSLRREVADAGIRVSIISPGFIDTELTKEVQRIFAGLGVPMGRPEQVAKVIVRAIGRNRREFIYPAYYRLFTWAEINAPLLVDYVSALYMRRVLPKHHARVQEGQAEPRPPAAE